MVVADKKQLIASLEAYLDNRISGDSLLNVWEQSDAGLQAVYYNLFHLVSDEDIRNRDESYRDYQIGQLRSLIHSLKSNQPVDVLKRMTFL